MISVSYGHRARGNAQVNTPENVTVSPARICHFCHIIWRDLTKICLQQLSRSIRRKIGEKTDRATLSGRTIFLSIKAEFSVKILFLPHNMAAERGQHHKSKNGKNGHATLCGRAVCSIMLCLQRLQRNLRHIIWQKSAMI